MEMKYYVLGLALLMYALVIFKQSKKVWFTTFAALIIIAVGVVSPGSIFALQTESRIYSVTHALSELINWNVLLIYVGSMIIASLFIYSKVPSRIADALVQFSPSTGIAIVLILVMTGIISIFVENVATVLVMAPIALALCKKLQINPTYFLCGLAVMSNLEGTATLVGDPPSMIFASYAGYTFNDFFIHEGKLSVFFMIQAGLISGALFFYSYFRKQKQKLESQNTKILSSVPLVLLLLMIFGLAAISFLSLEGAFVSGGFVFALGVVGILWFYFVRKNTLSDTWHLIKELDWETIFFLIGVFVVVGAISETGLLSDFASFLTKATGGSRLLGFLLIIIVSIIISGFIDNVPYIIVMLPVASECAKALNLAPELYMFALLIGSCLGGNLTPFGASANVVATGILKKEGYPVSFSGWLKIGAPFTLITTGVASIMLYLIWK